MKKNTIEEWDWSVLTFPSRYGNHYFAMAYSVPHELLKLYDILTGSDQEALDFECYLENSGNWLPITSGEDIGDATTKLLNRIEKYKYDDKWRNYVFEAFQYIKDNIMNLEQISEEKYSNSLKYRGGNVK